MTKPIQFLIFKLLLLFTITISAQDVFLKQELNLRENDYVLDNVFPIVNQKNKDFALFFHETKVLFAYLFDQHNNKIGEIFTDEIPRKYKNLLGYEIDPNNKKYAVFSSNNKRTSFLITSFDFDTKTVLSKEIKIPVQTELFVQALTHNNKLTFVTITKNSSVLNLYSFDETYKYKKNRIELKDFGFLNKKGKKTSLYNILLEKSNFSFKQNTFSDLSFEMIDTSLPVPLEAASNLNKLYIRDSKALFTFDGYNNLLQILSIDLENFEWKKRTVEKPMPRVPSNEKKTNSFINEDNLFLIACSKRGLLLEIKDLRSGETQSKHSILVNEKINISNTPIVQEGGVYNDYREFDRTDKFIRKVFSSNAAVAVNPYGSKYEITLGGSKTVSRGGPPMMMPMPGFPVATIGSMNMNLTLTYYNYHTNDKSIYFTGLFDENFEHLEGELEINSFDRIDSFKEDRRDRVFAETIFQYGESVLWGEYLPKNNTYVLRGF